MDITEFLMRAGLDAEMVEAWIEAGWLVPGRHAGAWHFSDVDLARAQLISDLRADLGVNDEGVAVVLDLIDQLHGLRCTLRDVVFAVGAQPEGTRRRIIADTQVAAFVRSAAPDNDAFAERS